MIPLRSRSTVSCSRITSGMSSPGKRSSTHAGHSGRSCPHSVFVYASKRRSTRRFSSRGSRRRRFASVNNRMASVSFCSATRYSAASRACSASRRERDQRTNRAPLSSTVAASGIESQLSSSPYGSVETKTLTARSIELQRRTHFLNHGFRPLLALRRRMEECENACLHSAFVPRVVVLVPAVYPSDQEPSHREPMSEL